LSTPDGFLTVHHDTPHPTEYARLRGARLLVCSEQSSGSHFDKAKVKKLTGGDKLTGRFMRGDFFDFIPSHLVVVLSNYRPQVKEGGPSFWRRVRMLPFLHVVPPEKRIHDLDRILIDAEGPAILGWMVHGAKTVLASGLVDPPNVARATEDCVCAHARGKLFRGPLSVTCHLSTLSR
jgi:putative DNA primase/helicase